MGKIKVNINGKEFQIEEEFHDWHLVRYLREELGLTGTKQGCDSEGACGLCKVIINGRTEISCRKKVSALDGANIETIENLAINGQLPHPLIQTVIQDGIFQCGYCAPGAILSAKALLDENDNPSQKEVARALSGVVCRCAGLNRMDKSVLRAAAILRGEAESTWMEEDTRNEYAMLEKLTGKLIYTDDLRFPNMAYAKAFRAKVAHGEIKNLDVSAAEKMPGILAVLTSKDIPGENAYGVITPDQQVFCTEKVRYYGDPLALVIGDTQEQVNAALEKINVDIDPLPVINNTTEALAEGAPVLHSYLKEKYPDMPNVMKHFHVSKGDITEGFKQADLIYEQSYKVPFVEHAYMETETSIAVADEDGTIKIYVGSQGPTDDRMQLAKVLDMEEERIQIAHMYMGGGFGGKEDIAGQIHAALAALKTGRSVKVHWDRTESLITSYKRHAADLHYKFGLTKDGRITAAQVTAYGDTGAYASSGEAVLFRMMAFACGPYEVPHADVNSYGVHTNNNPCGAFRGYGSPQVTFAVETHLEHMICELGLDPVETRLKNALDYGKATITGDVLTREVGAGMVECLTAVKEALAKIEIPEAGEDEKIGIGVACAYKNVGLGANIPDQAGAIVQLQSDGTFLVRHGAADMGQGSNQVMAAITSKVLGIPIGDIRVHTGDTRLDPHGGMTTASRATFVSGNAVLMAAEGLKKHLWDYVSNEFNVGVEDLAIHDGKFISKNDGREFIALKTLAENSEEFVFESSYHAPKTQPPRDYSESNPPIPEAPLHFAYDFGAQAAIVSVNVKTGRVRVLKMIVAHDSGTPIIFKNVIGQLEGAAIQGMGYALSESFDYDQGVPKSLKFNDLGVPRFRDLPEIEVIPITTPHPKGPFGAKGMGELAITPAAPAIINAIHDAVGVWIRELPATKEKVLKALQMESEMEVE